MKKAHQIAAVMLAMLILLSSAYGQREPEVGLDYDKFKDTTHVFSTPAHLESTGKFAILFKSIYVGFSCLFDGKTPAKDTEITFAVYNRGKEVAFGTPPYTATFLVNGNRDVLTTKERTLEYHSGLIEILYFSPKRLNLIPLVKAVEPIELQVEHFETTLTPAVVSQLKDVLTLCTQPPGKQ